MLTFNTLQMPYSCSAKFIYFASVRHITQRKHTRHLFVTLSKQPIRQRKKKRKEKENEKLEGIEKVSSSRPS